MTQLCEVCQRPMGEQATFCAADAYNLDAALADITAYRGLAYDLDLAITRQARIGSRDGSRPTEAAVPYNVKASETAANLKGVLASWAKLIIEETGAGTVLTLGPACRTCQHSSCREIRTQGLPADTLTGIAAWLRPRVGWLRHHPAGAGAYDEITEAVREARRICDRPRERLYAGPCNECGVDLYAIPGALIVECKPCELAYEVEARRVWLLGALEDHLVNATQMSRLVTYLGIKLADSTIRAWAMKGRIVSHGHDLKGNPMYRLGDVVRTYYNPTSGRVSA